MTDIQIKEDVEKKFKTLEELTLMDDYMFAAVMRDKINIKPLLEIILQVKIVDLEFVEPQKTEKEGYQSHGIRLDLYVKDDKGRIFNVEVQTSSRRHLPKRMRYYQSVIDINILAPGVDYSSLRISFVIFICNYDPFGTGRYIYTFENRCIEDTDLVLGDETRKVIVNTKGTVGEISDELRELIAYLDDGKATGTYTRQLEDAVEVIKSSEERRHEYMIMMVHDMEVREEGRAEGRIIGIIETMREDGKDDQTIIARLRSKFNFTQDEAERYVFTAADV